MHVVNRRVAWWAAAALVLIGLSIAASSHPGSARAANVPVSISGFAFAPATKTISVGDTVTWTNNETSVPHTATSDSGVTPAFDTGTISAGTSASVTFMQAGTFAYHCSIHPSMHGTIVVEAAPAAATPTAPQPTTTSAPAGTTPAQSATPPPTATSTPRPTATTPSSTSTPVAAAASVQPSPAPQAPAAGGGNESADGWLPGWPNLLKATVLIAIAISAFGIVAAIRRRHVS
jgi:plastocyanin